MPLRPFALLAFAAVTACGGADDAAQAYYDEARPTCAYLCASAACEGTVELSESSVQSCADSCADEAEAAARDESQDCAEAYLALLECVADAACTERLDWLADPQLSAVCRSEADALEATCPDFEFSFGRAGGSGAAGRP